MPNDKWLMPKRSHNRRVSTGIQSSQRLMSDTRNTRSVGGDVSVDPVIEAYKKDIDLTLIREQLRRTPDERVERMLAALRLAEELRAAGSARRR